MYIATLVLGHLHCLFILAFVLGIILKMYWLMKYAKKEVLYKHAKILLLVGLVGALVTAPFAMKMKMKMKYHGKDGRGGYEWMMKHKEMMMGEEESEEVAEEETVE